MIKTTDTTFIEEPKIGYSEEEKQKIKDWVENPLTQNLALALRNQIISYTKTWVAGGYCPPENKSMGDYTSGFCSGLNHVAETLETGGLQNVS